MDGHARCWPCRKQQRRQEEDVLSAAAAAPAPAAPAPPPPLFPSHAGSHAPLPLIQRAAIVVLDKQGLPRGKIAQQAGTSLPSVRRWVRRFEETKELADEPRSGRPRCTDEALDTAVAFVSRVEPFATPRQLKRKLQLDMSVDTIDRRLIEAGLPGRVSRHVFQLTDGHKRKRLSFAQGYERWTEDDWCKVLFADVKTFEGTGHHGQVWVRRPVGEAANPAYSVAHKPHPVAMPAWGCFSAHGPGYMAMFEGSLDATALRNIFRDYLLPTVREHFADGDQWWLLHDNDPGRHKSQVLLTWMHNNYVRPLDFPPYSPDLNPIENLWAEMDKRMASTRADTKEELEKVVAETWAAITAEFCDKLARSMPTRIAQVIERNGAYTDY
jgi:transposase